MYRLTDDLARRRQLYPLLIVGAPHILINDLPSHFRVPGLGLDRYYSVLPETEGEVAEIKRFLSASLVRPVSHDHLDRRPTSVRATDLSIIRYHPPARGCYTFEVFEDEEALQRQWLELMDSLSRYRNLSIRTIAAEHLPPAGTA